MIIILNVYYKELDHLMLEQYIVVLERYLFNHPNYDVRRAYVLKKIDTVLSNFYHCLSIPIQFTNPEFKVLFAEGLSLNLQAMIDQTSLFEDITGSIDCLTQFTYFETIHFLVYPLTHIKTDNGYFIVGPFQTSNDHMADIPFKPESCIELIGKMLEHIIKHQLLSERKFNPYVKDGITYIHQNYAQTFSLDDVCHHLNINKSYFCTIFKNETGMTFSTFLNRVRIEKSKQYLRESRYSILEIALAVGFNNHNYYSSIFKKLNGITPIEYRHRFLP